jgi:hypothetical protein
MRSKKKNHLRSVANTQGGECGTASDVIRSSVLEEPGQQTEDGGAPYVLVKKKTRYLGSLQSGEPDKAIAMIWADALMMMPQVGRKWGRAPGGAETIAQGLMARDTLLLELPPCASQ